MKIKNLPSTSHLGKQIASFGSNYFEKFGMGNLLFLIALIVTPYIWYQFITTWMNKGISAVLNANMLIGVIGFSLIFLFVLSQIYVWWKSRKNRLSIYELGFTFVEYGSEVTWLWNEIESIQHVARKNLDAKNRYHNTFHQYTIRGIGKADLMLDSDVSKINQAMQLIQDKTTEVLLPPIIKRILEGEKIRFGPIVVDQKGIFIDASFSEWQMIKHILVLYQTHGVLQQETQVPFISIWRKDQDSAWQQVDVCDVPNSFIFLKVGKLLIESTRISSPSSQAAELNPAG